MAINEVTRQVLQLAGFSETLTGHLYPRVHFREYENKAKVLSSVGKNSSHPNLTGFYLCVGRAESAALFIMKNSCKVLLLLWNAIVRKPRYFSTNTAQFPMGDTQSIFCLAQIFFTISQKEKKEGKRRRRRKRRKSRRSTRANDVLRNTFLCWVRVMIWLAVVVTHPALCPASTRQSPGVWQVVRNYQARGTKISKQHALPITGKQRNKDLK